MSLRHPVAFYSLVGLWCLNPPGGLWCLTPPPILFLFLSLPLFLSLALSLFPSPSVSFAISRSLFLFIFVLSLSLVFSLSCALSLSLSLSLSPSLSVVFLTFFLPFSFFQIFVPVSLSFCLPSFFFLPYISHPFILSRQSSFSPSLFPFHFLWLFLFLSISLLSFSVHIYFIPSSSLSDFLVLPVYLIFSFSASLSLSFFLGCPPFPPFLVSFYRYISSPHPLSPILSFSSHISCGYGVVTIGRLLKIIGLFCKRAL